MEEFRPEPPAPSSAATKTNRLTRAEIYAMKIAKPRRRPMAFLLGSLATAAILGSALWLLRDYWLPYWLPEPIAAEAPSPAAAPEAPTPPAVLPPPAAPEPPVAAFAPETLDFLSAAAWDHPPFLQAVRAFNQALERSRPARAGGNDAPLLARIEETGTRAAGVFDSLAGEAPAAVPLAAYAAQARRLAAEARQLAAPPPAPAPPPELTAEEMRKDPDFLEAARLFNRALEQFNLYRADTSRTDRLGPAEDFARQAGQKFEALKQRAPEHFFRELDRHIHQSYGIVSACRGAQLQRGGATTSPEPAGPSRRPALPAYSAP